MSERSTRRGFAARPTNPDAWITAVDARASGAPNASSFTARLTIDITPELRGRIKIIAFQRGVTVADMLRELLAREFPSSPGEIP